MHKFLAAFFCLCSLCLPANIQAVELNLAPLVYYQSDESEREFNLLGPVFERTNDYQALRPLYYHDEQRSEYFYPLGSSNKGRSHFVPFYRSDTEGDNPSGELFPCFWGTYEGQKYGGLFPIYGTLTHRLGKDKVGFVLWPLYSWSKTDEVKTTSILWPIFTYSKNHEFKIFPLYGQETNASGSYHYVLWPIFLNKNMYDERMHAVLPLYISTRGNKYRSTSILWPFFTFNQDSETGHTSKDILWPLGRFAHGGYEETRIFPFYWKKIMNNGYSRKIIMWPVYLTETDDKPDQNYYEKNNRYLLLGSYKEVQHKNNAIHRLYILPIWFSYKDNAISRWQFPYILPITDAGYRRNWEPLFTLAHGQKTSDTYEYDILWHMLYYSRKTDKTRFVLSFLGSYEHAADYRQIGLLCDLLKFRWEIDPADIKDQDSVPSTE